MHPGHCLQLINAGSGNEESDWHGYRKERKEIFSNATRRYLEHLKISVFSSFKIHFLQELYYSQTGACIDKCLRLAVCFKTLKKDF